MKAKCKHTRDVVGSSGIRYVPLLSSLSAHSHEYWTNTLCNITIENLMNTFNDYFCKTTYVNIDANVDLLVSPPL